MPLLLQFLPAPPI
uniref:Pco064740 n=1 Tax=Arundo donax TaxID=35708 RepID=A0A0A9FYU0_ARUDO